jgi:hypothetical protein
VHIVGATQQQRRGRTGLGAVDLDLLCVVERGRGEAKRDVGVENSASKGVALVLVPLILICSEEGGRQQKQNAMLLSGTVRARGYARWSWCR